jgi:hypothetical protein
MFIDHTETIQRSFNCFKTIEPFPFFSSDDNKLYCNVRTTDCMVWQGENFDFTSENRTAQNIKCRGQ